MIKKHIVHSHHRPFFVYPVSAWQKFYSLLLYPLLYVVVLFFVVKLLSHTGFSVSLPVSLSDIFIALFYTVSRIFIAYVLSLAVALPLALLATSGPVAEKIFLPIFDILESVPTLAFFPIFIIFFVRGGFLNAAAIFILFIAMLWNIVFTLVGGLKIIPQDIKQAASVFKISGWQYFKKVTLPAVFPQIVTGSILAVAQAWNIIIVAEVLHTYIPGGTKAEDLFGMGSVLVGASASGQNDLFIVAILVMILAIAFLNFFIWQKLLHYAQKFRFE